MGSVIRSVSMTKDEDAFLSDYQLSPSQLLKEKIWEFRGALKSLVGDKIARMAKVINDQAAQIEKMEKQLTLDDENVVEEEDPDK